LAGLQFRHRPDKVSRMLTAREMTNRGSRRSSSHQLSVAFDTSPAVNAGAFLSLIQIKNMQVGSGTSILLKRGWRQTCALGVLAYRSILHLKTEIAVICFSEWQIDPQKRWIFPPWPGANFPEPPDR
jgi:hypothetical protein